MRELHRNSEESEEVFEQALDVKIVGSDVLEAIDELESGQGNADTLEARIREGIEVIRTEALALCEGKTELKKEQAATINAHFAATTISMPEEAEAMFRAYNSLEWIKDATDEEIIELLQWNYAYLLGSHRLLEQELPEMHERIANDITMLIDEGLLPPRASSLIEEALTLTNVQSIDAVEAGMRACNAYYSKEEGLIGMFANLMHGEDVLRYRILLHEYAHAMQVIGNTAFKNLYGSKEAVDMTFWLQELSAEHIAQAAVNGDPPLIDPDGRLGQGSYYEIRKLSSVFFGYGDPPAHIEELMAVGFEDLDNASAARQELCDLLRENFIEIFPEYPEGAMLAFTRQYNAVETSGQRREVAIQWLEDLQDRLPEDEFGYLEPPTIEAGRSFGLVSPND